jgi:hypothetical protein
LQPALAVVVLFACVAPAIIAAVLLWVAFGPVPARRTPFAPRSFDAPRGPQAAPIPVPLHGAQFSPSVAVTPAPAPMPVPVAAPAPIPRPALAAMPIAVTPVELPRRAARTFDPALAPVVRSPRGSDLPPLRRVARGTDAPPILRDVDTEEEHTDELQIFDVDDLTTVELQ